MGEAGAGRLALLVGLFHLAFAEAFLACAEASFKLGSIGSVNEAPWEARSRVSSAYWADELSEAWEREYPDLDTSALPALTLLARLSVLVEAFQLEVLEPFELSPGDYSVLAMLRRSGKPYELNPNQLYSRLQRSSGGMAKMLKRLEQRGLIRRSPDPDDGRGSRVRLTRRGVALQERAFLAFLVASQQRVGVLEASELGQAEASFRSFLRAFEATA